jgi:hypothetical protein
MFSHTIAKFVSAQLDEPIIWNDDIAKGDSDALFIIAGGMPFCGHLPALGKAVLQAKEVIYCTNDYKTTKLPDITTKAKTPFRASFRLRHKRGMSKPQRWSTIEGDDAYVNWNALAWEPSFKWNGKAKSLLYYGSWRKNRIPYFDLYFKNPPVSTVISNNSGRFEEAYPYCVHLKSLPRENGNIVGALSNYGAGLYIEDPFMHGKFQSLACRFYEMLSAGLPIIFHAPCLPMLEKAGLKVPDSMLTHSPEDINRLMKNRKSIAKDQAEWRKDFHSDTVYQFQCSLASI